MANSNYFSLSQISQLRGAAAAAATHCYLSSERVDLFGRLLQKDSTSAVDYSPGLDTAREQMVTKWEREREREITRLADRQT